MQSHTRVRRLFDFLFSIDQHDRVKVLLLTVAFFFIIGAYTLAKELKDIVFITVVGRDKIWLAKIISIFMLVPAILVYSKLVDKLRRYHLLSFYCLVYGLLGLVFTYLLSHPVIGFANTNTSPYRIFGWIFYFFIEGYSPFVVSVFWAFSNSISDPDGAKKSYGLMVSGSKLGGMLAAACAWYLLRMNESGYLLLGHTLKHQILLAVSSVMLLCVPIILFLLIRAVPGRYLHGYEAVYKVEKHRSEKGKAETGILSGLIMLLRYPYTMGIFCIALFYEVIQAVLSYQRLGIAQENASSASDVSAYLFSLSFFTHFAGFLISLLGTRALLSKFGERNCLLMVPFFTTLLFIFFRINSTLFAFHVLFVMFRSIHYAFSSPLRESLYIPTVKEIKFKSKSWIDSFGTKFARGIGSAFNGATSGLSMAMFLMAESIFFSGIICCWFVVAYLLGRRFEKAIARNEAIGIE
jgi:ATP:ADP antiporter, AAA family